MKRFAMMVIMILAAFGCGNANNAAAPEARSGPAPSELPQTTVEVEPGLAVATFAGGCFWCMEPPFDELEGVRSTISGYAGGWVEQPTYEQVSAGTTGHTEVVQVLYDPSTVSYEQLLAVFWRNIDPLTPDAQFCDRGSQYRSEIFVHDAAQRDAALASKQAIEDSGRFDAPVVTAVTDFSNFYPAEDYHQDYYLKNPRRYKFYRYNCGRDRRLDQLWGD